MQHSFTFKGSKIPLDVDFGKAHKVFPKHGLHILGLLVDENINKTLLTILTDDLQMLNLWYHYVKDLYPSDFEELIDDLTTVDFKSFKDALWAAIVNFTDPQLRAALIKGREEIERQLAKTFRNLKLKEPSSDTVDESE